MLLCTGSVLYHNAAQTLAFLKTYLFFGFWVNFCFVTDALSARQGESDSTTPAQLSFSRANCFQISATAG
jgi:hypothetical protein